MGVIFDKDTALYDDYPFFSVGLFSGILGLVFSALELSNIARIFYVVIPLAFVTKLLFFIPDFLEHPVSKFCVRSLFLGIDFLILGNVGLLPLKIQLATIIGFIALVIGALAVTLALISFLIRIFIGIFIG